MPEDRDQLIQHFNGMRRTLLAAIDGMSDSQLATPGPDGWAVKDHFTHLAAWDDMRAEEVVRISAGHESAWRMTDQQVTEYNDMVHEMRHDFSVAQARWELDASRDRLLAAIAAATLRALDSALYGEAVLFSTHEDEHAGWIRELRASLR